MTRERALDAIAGMAGAAAFFTVARHLGLGPFAVTRSLAILALAVLPPGILAVRSLPGKFLGRGEALLLAALVGHPLSAALYYLFALAGLRGAFLPVMTVLGVVLLLGNRRGSVPLSDRESAVVTPPWIRRTLVVVIPLLLFALTRGNRAFEPVAAGRAYEHSVDHSIQLSLYWELLRGIPPQQLPAAAGMPFPSYHALAFIPGVWLAETAKVPVIAVYHAASPLFRLGLLTAGLYLAVRLRTGDPRLALASLLAAFGLDAAFEAAFVGRLVEGPSPYYFFLRSDSGGAAMAVWAAVFALLALHHRARQAGDPTAPRALYLASVLAALAVSFKAQTFVLFGGATSAALAFGFLRDRSAPLIRALLALVATATVFLWLGRGEGPLGRVFITPGLFAEMYVYPNLLRDASALLRRLGATLAQLPGGLGWMLATPMALWRLVAFSPLVPAFVVSAARSWRGLSLTDAAAALVFLLSLPLGYFFSAIGLDLTVSPFEFLQAAQGLAPLGAAVSVIAAGSFLDRRGRDGGGSIVRMLVPLSGAAWVYLAVSTPYLPPREAILLSPDEECALLFLRNRTAYDAVVASDRSDSFEELRRTSKRLNHQAVVAGLAGRRAVWEFYGEEVDPVRNRPRALKRLFSTTDSAVAETLLRRYAPDYMLEYPGLPLGFPKRGLLDLAFERGGVRVYRFGSEKPPGPVENGPFPPRPVLGLADDADDLTCR